MKEPAWTPNEIDRRRDDELNQQPVIPGIDEVDQAPELFPLEVD